MKEGEQDCKFKFLETRNLNQDALEKTFGAIRLYCGSNNNQYIKQFVDTPKTVINNGLAYRSLYGTKCEDDGASLLDKLHSFLKPSNSSSTSPFTSHDSETTDSVPYIVHIGKEVQRGVSATVCVYDMKMFSVAYDSGFIAKHLLNLLKPTGHVMHQQFNVQQLYVLPTLYLYVLYLSENKQRLVPLTA